MPSNKVVHLTSVHHPFDNRILLKECATLALAGYEVTLIAAGDGVETAHRGVRLKLVPQPRNRIQRALLTIPAVLRAALAENADIYHYHDPELMPVGWLLHKKGKKVIYDVHEDYAGSIRYKPWIPTLLRGITSDAVSLCERIFSRRCTRVIAATPTIVEQFDQNKARLVQNFPWMHEFGSSQGKPYRQREPIVAYVGTIAQNRGLNEMCAAIAIVNRSNPVRLVLAGKMNPGAGDASALNNLEQEVTYRGALPRQEVGLLLAEARIGIVTLHPTLNYVSSQPTKLYEYMSAGIPVIASDFPVWRSVVESSGCGILVDPKNPNEIAAAIMHLLRDPDHAQAMGERGRKAVIDRFNWEAEGANLLRIYSEIAS